MSVRAVRLACAAVLCAAAVAPADEPLRLTLDEAVARAIQASPRLGSLEALERAADAGTREAHAQRLPQLGVSGLYRRHSDVPELILQTPGAPPRTIFPNIPDNYALRVEASVPVYTGGALGALQDAARAELRAAGDDRQAGVGDVALQARTAYWSLVTTRASESVLSESLQAFEAHLADARHREQFGLAARNEVLAVQVERDRAELSRLRAHQAAELAEVDLVRLIGEPPGTHLEPVEPLAAPRTAEAPRDRQEAWVAEALERRPERAALAARIDAAEAGARAERAARLPHVSASASWDYANPNREILPPEAAWQDTWQVSMGVRWTAFDGGRASASAARARARAGALRQQLADLERRLRLEVTSATLALVTEAQAVEVARRNVEAARENGRVAGERHEAGVIPSSERLDAEVALLRAGLDLTEAEARLRVAQAALDRAVGRDVR